MLTHINNPNKRRAGRSTTRTTIDWTSISQVVIHRYTYLHHQLVGLVIVYLCIDCATQLMGRPYMDCKGKWKKIKAFNMKKGNSFARKFFLKILKHHITYIQVPSRRRKMQ